MSQDKIKTEECFVASIDLLGIKELIKKDTDNRHLKNIKNIYESWIRIKKDYEFSKLQFKAFSDNVVIAINKEIPKAADILLEFVSYMAEHLLKFGYKPRGGVSAGEIYIDNTFTWGKGLVKAYELESKYAKYPRIIVDDDIITAATDHIKNQLFVIDKDGRTYINYINAFGDNKEGRLKKTKDAKAYLQPEIDDIEREINIFVEKKQDDQRLVELKRILVKLEWMRDEFLDMNEKINC